MSFDEWPTDVIEILDLLDSIYGIQELNDCKPPLDTLILTILSQSTSSINCRRAFTNLKRAFPNWDDMLHVDLNALVDVIHMAGLSHVKAIYIRSIINELYQSTGKIDLDNLYELSDEEAMHYLMQFNGVGNKTASCVLLFSLGRKTFPVDTHILRLAKRLGLISLKETAQTAHNSMKALIPPDRRYSAHVNMITFGRHICKARNPACGFCALRTYCDWINGRHLDGSR